MKKQLFWISLSYATFGIIVKNNIVVETAPIARWMIGKNIENIKIWAKNKKGIVKEIK